jgi:hypothetical protein
MSKETEDEFKEVIIMMDLEFKMGNNFSKSK